MKRSGIVLISLVAAVVGVIANQTTDAVRKICLPISEVVGRSPDEAMVLIEKLTAHDAVLPIAVVVLLDEKRCRSITAKYPAGSVVFGDVAALLTARYGKPLAEDLINTANWRFVARDGKKINARLHKQEDRVTVDYYAVDPEEDTY